MSTKIVTVNKSPISDRYWYKGCTGTIVNDQIRVGGIWFDFDERWEVVDTIKGVGTDLNNVDNVAPLNHTMKIPKTELNKSTVYITKGLPASGKTTWAKEHQKMYPMCKRVNKDELRAMLDNDRYGTDTEKFVCGIRDEIIRRAIEKNCNIIVDDCNLDPRHLVRFEKIIKDRANIVIKDFTDVPLNVCGYRNSLREKPIPDLDIINMYNKFIKEN